jgi:hypothetical protein
MGKKDIILTFDYEVFLGKSGTIDKCILQPVNSLLDVLDKAGIKGVFFVDILHLVKLEEVGNTTDFNKLKSNIQDLLKRGHFAELHIHPHWIDAVYNVEEKIWDLSENRFYKVSSLSKDQVRKVFSDGIELLSAIGKEVIGTYEIKSFRAGGLCIQPFSDFREVLLENNILIESSVAPGLKNEDPIQSFDFSNGCKYEPYKFSEDPLVEIESGPFTQYPLTLYKVSFLDKIVSKLKKDSAGNNIFGDGESVKKNGYSNTSFLGRFKSSLFLFSLDGDYYESILINRIVKSKLETITFISHPKLLSKNSLLTIQKLSRRSDLSFKSFV